MKQILSQLKITDLSAKMGKLSGGQIKRVALAKLLTETRAQHTHTLLIMDEPTNHLDVEMVEWLENYLSKEKITLLCNSRPIFSRFCLRYYLGNGR
jgi:ATP-binding cassette subfamily F protein uup